MKITPDLFDVEGGIPSDPNNKPKAGASISVDGPYPSREKHAAPKEDLETGNKA